MGIQHIHIGIPATHHLNHRSQTQLIDAAADRLAEFVPVKAKDGLALTITLQQETMMDDTLLRIREALNRDKPLEVSVSKASVGLGSILRKRTGDTGAA